MIAKEGWIFVISFVVLGIAFISVIPWVGTWAVVFGSLFFIAGLFNLFFFRNPERIIKPNDTVILSAGDGVVMEVIKNYTSGMRNGTMVKIFLSIFNVHIQRAPIAGVIEDIHYHKGTFLPAMNPEAYRRNERNTIIIRNNKGNIEVSQIAGILARRIRCWFEQGESLALGQRYGLICFGSQVDMFLPESVNITVLKGDKVAAGRTVIGEWQSS